MPYIFARIGFGQWSKMTRGQNPLLNLLEARICEHLTELRLAEKQTLKWCAPFYRHVRKHAQFFQRRNRQVLYLVDDQQTSFTCYTHVFKKLLELLEQY